MKVFGIAIVEQVSIAKGGSIMCWPLKVSLRLKNN